MKPRKRPFRRYLWRDPDHPEREPLKLWRGEALDRVVKRHAATVWMNAALAGRADWMIELVQSDWNRDVRLR
jgi:hypothetical protein